MDSWRVVYEISSAADLCILASRETTRFNLLSQLRLKCVRDFKVVDWGKTNGSQGDCSHAGNVEFFINGNGILSANRSIFSDENPTVVVFFACWEIALANIKGFLDDKIV